MPLLRAKDSAEPVGSAAHKGVLEAVPDKEVLAVPLKLTVGDAVMELGGGLAAVAAGGGVEVPDRLLPAVLGVGVGVGVCMGEGVGEPLGVPEAVALAGPTTATTVTLPLAPGAVAVQLPVNFALLALTKEDPPPPAPP